MIDMTLMIMLIDWTTSTYAHTLPFKSLGSYSYSF